MGTCPECGKVAKSWVHCPKGELICDKCCGSCSKLDSRTSIIRCTYKKEKRT